MEPIYRRSALAKEMAHQLLHPGVLDEGLRSGLFLSGLRRTGKTTFLRNDLIPALEAAGAVVIYVDLWSDAQANPATLVRAAVRQTLADLASPDSSLLGRLRRLSALEIGAGGLHFGFRLDTVGDSGGATLSEAFLNLVDQLKTNVVLIIDEVQHAITTEDGQQMLLALKAARDAINQRPGTPGRFIFLGTGSHRAMVSELSTRRNQAFSGATSLPYPLLDADYVDHLMQRLASEDSLRLPSREVVIAAFRTLGSRPEELLRGFRLLHQQQGSQGEPDLQFPVIAATLRAAAADVELAKIEQMGGLALAVFARIAETGGDARGVFSADAVGGYSQVVGRAVRVEEIQPLVNELMSANLIMRKAHGTYAVTDPFVQEAWLERGRLLAGPGAAPQE